MVLVHEMPNRPNICLKNPSCATEIKKGKKEFTFKFSAWEDLKMHISFPSCGGVRVHNGKEGVFRPTELLDIEYDTIDSYSVKMTSNGIGIIFVSTPEMWKIEFYGADGESKTELCCECGTWAPSPFKVGINIDEEPALYRISLPKRENEMFYGFGERFNSLSQNGSRLIMWNVDAITTANGNYDLSDENCDKTQAYKNIPLFHSTNGYSVFFNTYLPIFFDVGYGKPERLMTEIYGTQLDFYVWAGCAENGITNYHTLTGKPFIPPKWAFDYWLGGGWPIWNTPTPDNALEKLTRVIDKYKDIGVTINNAYLETNPTREVLCGLRDRGIRTFMWTDSGLPPYGKSKLNYDDYRVKKLSNPSAVMKHKYIDFTTEASIDVINDKFEKPWEYGVCGEMVDFADSLPQDSLCSNGKSGIEMHNEYAYWYGRRMNEAFSARLGKDFVLFQRSGCAGSQHYTAAFGGDSYSTFLGLKRSVWEMLSAAASGISVWGSDIGGFMLRKGMTDEGPEFEELYMRWVQFGAFSPLMRDHSWHGKHHPWSNGPRGLENFKFYYDLRLRLLDLIYSSALKSGKFGGTMVNSMAASYGMSPEIDLQYMFCEDFLVKPITESGVLKTEVTFPEDGFCDFYTGKRYGTGKYTVDAPTDRIPLFIRPGSVIAYNDYENGVISTKAKTEYVKALILTVPVFKRTELFLSDDNCFEFVSIPENGGFTVKCDAPCDRRRIIVAGAPSAEISCGGNTLQMLSIGEKNAVTAELDNNWKEIHIRIKG